MANGELYLLAESSIKIEEVKEEPVFENEDYCWNSNAKVESSALQHSVKEEDINDEEELEPPEVVFVEPTEEQGAAPCIDETKIGTCTPTLVKNLSSVLSVKRASERKED
ncbi:Protein of unknown function [Gryllus bimaculatus]|nr:Protein of unknown function [Gryllus bimaculatus]